MLEVHPSAGSIFKKIEGWDRALVDQCGSKDTASRCTDLLHSRKHHPHLGHATAADVRAIIDHAQKTVATRLGYSLEPEIMFVGEFAGSA